MSLERVTVTLDRALLARADACVDGIRFKSRSHAVAGLLRKALSGEGVSKALVLAGGRPNPTVLEATLTRLKAFGVGEAVIALSKGGEAVVARFKDGAGSGLKLVYSWDEGRGSALALLKARQLLGEQPFLLSYADVLYPALDLADLERFHALNGGACTLALAGVGDPRNYGVAKLEGSRVVEFAEKPRKAASYLVNAGVAVCDPRVFSFLNERMASIEMDLLPLLARKGELYGYPYSGEWKHTG